MFLESDFVYHCEGDECKQRAFSSKLSKPVQHIQWTRASVTFGECLGTFGTAKHCILRASSQTFAVANLVFWNPDKRF